MQRYGVRCMSILRVRCVSQGSLQRALDPEVGLERVLEGLRRRRRAARPRHRGAGLPGPGGRASWGGGGTMRTIKLCVQSGTLWQCRGSLLETCNALSLCGRQLLKHGQRADLLHIDLQGARRLPTATPPDPLWVLALGEEECRPATPVAGRGQASTIACRGSFQISLTYYYKFLSRLRRGDFRYTTIPLKAICD